MGLEDGHLVLADMLGGVDDLLQSQYLLPLAFVIVAILLLRRPRKPSNTPPSVTAARSLTSSLGTQDRIRRDLETLMVELQELSRKISAEIDTRFAKLEAAMRDADRRIAALNRLSRKVGQSPTPADDPAEPDIRHQIVYELADAGKNSVEVAKELGKTPGEVELILNLRGKTGTSLNVDPDAQSASPANFDAASQPVAKSRQAPKSRKKTDKAE